MVRGMEPADRSAWTTLADPPTMERMSTPSDDGKLHKARKTAGKMGLPQAKRHLLVCCDTDEAGCAAKRDMKDAWRALKQCLKQHGIEDQVIRTRSDCLEICAGGGPIVVVEPDGIWYGACTPENIERIVSKHLVDGSVVHDLVIARRDEAGGSDG